MPDTSKVLLKVLLAALFVVSITMFEAMFPSFSINRAVYYSFLLILFLGGLLQMIHILSIMVRLANMPIQKLKNQFLEFFAVGLMVVFMVLTVGSVTWLIRVLAWLAVKKLMYWFGIPEDNLVPTLQAFSIVLFNF